MEKSLNVFGEKLECCCLDPITGFYRNGNCDTGKEDQGLHTVCIFVTDQFLQFSKEKGNDLSTPLPMFDFPGLVEGDKWCLCALRWKEAFEEGEAPKLYLTGTHQETLKYIPFETLAKFALDIQ